LLRKDFRDLGYVEGHNLVIDIRSAEGSAARLPALAADLGELKPDVIVTSTTDGALAYKQELRYSSVLSQATRFRMIRLTRS